MKHTPEPWFICTTEPAEIRTHPYGGVIIGETIPNAYNAERAVACVNACAGMADPVTEIQAMRAALEDSARAIRALLYNGHDSVERATETLAKIKPLINP